MSSGGGGSEEPPAIAEATKAIDELYRVHDTYFPIDQEDKNSNLQTLADAALSLLDSVPFVRYSRESLSFCHHFGHAGGVDRTVEQVVRPTDEVGTSTTAASATVLTVQEMASAGPSAGHQLEETSLDFGLSSRLSEMVKALLSDDDPDQALLCMEVGSFFFFVNAMIDKLLVKGFSFHQFKPALANKMTVIEKAGSSDLVQAIADDLNRLECEFQRLQELKTAGTSMYIATQMESRLQAWRDTRASAGLEVQAQQSRVDQIEAVLAEKQASLCQLKSSIMSSEAKIERLKEELKAEEEALAVLGMTKDDLEHSQVVISGKLELSKQKLAKIKQEAANTLSLSEESFNVELQRELERTYAEELTKLEQQVRSHKLHVD